jgi:hypothetical protein
MFYCFTDGTIRFLITGILWFLEWGAGLIRLSGFKPVVLSWLILLRVSRFEVLVLLEVMSNVTACSIFRVKDIIR